MTPKRFLQVMAISVISRDRFAVCFAWCLSSCFTLLEWGENWWWHCLVIVGYIKSFSPGPYIWLGQGTRSYRLIVKIIWTSSLSVLIFPSRESTSGKQPCTQTCLCSRKDHCLDWRSLLYVLPRIILLGMFSGRIFTFLKIFQLSPASIDIQMSDFVIPVLPVNWAEVSDVIPQVLFP